MNVPEHFVKEVREYVRQSDALRLSPHSSVVICHDVERVGERATELEEEYGGAFWDFLMDYSIGDLEGVCELGRMMQAGIIRHQLNEQKMLEEYAVCLFLIGVAANDTAVAVNNAIETLTGVFSFDDRRELFDE